MFTKRHEEELAEIKATTQQLAERFEEIVEQLERIKQNQDELAAQQGSSRGAKRKSGREEATVVGEESPGPQGPKRARRARAGGRKRRRTGAEGNASTTEE
jgi:hypothetical protein